jgi:hypothetical protein
MADEATREQPSTVLQTDNTDTPPRVLSSLVPVSASLTPQEIERICKAFIRLITAKETLPHGHNS